MDALKEIIGILSTFVMVAGGIWMAWGMISTGFAINNRDGNDIRNGLLMCVGAGLVLAGGVYLKTLA